MLTIGMLSLTAALASGVFGFGAGASPTWTWDKGAFVFFLLVAALSYISSELRRPSLLWAVIDDLSIRGIRKRRYRRERIRRIQRHLDSRAVGSVADRHISRRQFHDGKSQISMFELERP